MDRREGENIANEWKGDKINGSTPVVVDCFIISNQFLLIFKKISIQI